MVLFLLGKMLSTWSVEVHCSKKEYQITFGILRVCLEEINKSSCLLYPIQSAITLLHVNDSAEFLDSV